MADNYLNPFGSNVWTDGLNVDFGIGSSTPIEFPSYGHQVMAPSPTKPGQSFGGLGLGLAIGMAGEATGNIIRALKGVDPAPPGMATRALSDYFSQKQDTTLERILDRLFADTQDKFTRKERPSSPEDQTQLSA